MFQQKLTWFTKAQTEIEILFSVNHQLEGIGHETKIVARPKSLKTKQLKVRR